MNCRINITGQKSWIDNNNIYKTRPDTVAVNLLRDGEVYKTVTLDSNGDGKYSFPCLIVWKNPTTKYRYQVDENIVPTGYTKTIQGYNIINQYNGITVSGTKTWEDSNNAGKKRPVSITVKLLQNGIFVQSAIVLSPSDAEKVANFSFTGLPANDAGGAPYIYAVEEEPIQNYTKDVNGYNIINTLIP